MENQNFGYSAKSRAGVSLLNISHPAKTEQEIQEFSANTAISQVSQFPQEIWEFPALSDIIQSLENFQDFEPAVRQTTISLFASEMATRFSWQHETTELHLLQIASYVGLEVLR